VRKFLLEGEVPHEKICDEDDPYFPHEELKSLKADELDQALTLLTGIWDS
jgi:hypothetical protein